MSESVWHVSSGTAVVAHLAQARLDCAPTTAYIMLGERCSGDCAFCAQARSSAAHHNLLSRVAWPPYDAALAAEAVARACAEGSLRRICFQVTTGPGHTAAAIEAVRQLRPLTDCPICVSIAPRNLEDIGLLLNVGVSRVTMAIDAACERVARQVKSGSWQRTVELLTAAATAWPGCIGTHLIAGLGETEQEMARAMQHAVDLGIALGLFAFTPIAGTPMQSVAPPPLDSYRRLQAALWLISHGLARQEQFAYDEAACIEDYGLPYDQLRCALADPIASPFRTSGCTDCNRPYYNERPGAVPYNYPRPLTPAEATAEADALLGTLAD